jgi:hypothetical protein
VCVCSLWYTAWDAQAPYFQVWPVRLYNIFPHYLIKGTIHEKVTELKHVFWFPLQRSSETFLILRRNEWNLTKNVYWSSRKVPVILVRLNKAWVFSANFRKIPKYQISWKSVQWEPRCSMWTDGRTGLTKIIVAFHNFEKASNNWFEREPKASKKPTFPPNFTLLPWKWRQYVY